MSSRLSDVLRGGSAVGTPRIWLKSSKYCTRLLLGEGGDPWAGAAEYLVYFSQAQRLLQPDVAVIEVGELYDSWIARHDDLRAEMDSKRRLSFPLRKLLEQAGPRELLAEVLAAVAAQLRGCTPIVLAMPAPRPWLRHANRLAGRGEVEPDGDSVEDAAMYIADVARSVSTTPVAGLLLEEESGTGTGDETDLARYRPILNVAKHYHWSLVLRSGAGRATDLSALAGVDAMISADREHIGGITTGLDVSEPLWSGHPIPSPADQQFFFVEIPGGHHPESVLEHLARLRS